MEYNFWFEIYTEYIEFWNYHLSICVSDIYSTWDNISKNNDLTDKRKYLIWDIIYEFRFIFVHMFYVI